MASSSDDIVDSDQKSACFSNSLETYTAHLEHDDVIFLFTDGVSESVDINGKEYGQERIAELIQHCAGESVEHMHQRIINELSRHRTGVDLRDDTTFVLLKRI